MAQIGEDGKVRWNKLQYALEDIGNSVQDRKSNHHLDITRSCRVKFLTCRISALLGHHCEHIYCDCIRYVPSIQLRRSSCRFAADYFQKKLVMSPIYRSTSTRF